jgi:pimeloyl-ACP methyl ester carboxylesterase
LRPALAFWGALRRDDFRIKFDCNKIAGKSLLLPLAGTFAMSRAVFACLLLVFATSLSVSVHSQAHPASAPHEKVFLLRGFTNVLSPGIDELAQELKEKNIETEVANHAFAIPLASEAIEDCKSGRVGTVVLIGHSFGATGALMMADRMQKAGLRVALIVTLDPVIKGTVPANVHRLENFYLSNGVGTTMQPGENFHGAISNVDLKNNPELGHVSVTTLPAMQKQVIHDVVTANTRCG